MADTHSSTLSSPQPNSSFVPSMHWTTKPFGRPTMRQRRASTTLGERDDDLVSAMVDPHAAGK